MSSPTPEQWSAMEKLVQQFYAKPEAEPLREPVDWQALGLVDYPQVIKRPMDLGTVKKKLKEKAYKTLHEASDDVQLVWTNCMTYNQDGSDFFLLAQTLKKKWDDKVHKLLLQDASGSHSKKDSADGSKGVSLEEKRAFARSLYNITREDLGKVLVEMDTKCPQALTKNSAEDECEMNVDLIPPPIFQELMQMAKQAAENKKQSSKAKSKKIKA